MCVSIYFHQPYDHITCISRDMHTLDCNNIHSYHALKTFVEIAVMVLTLLHVRFAIKCTWQMCRDSEMH